MSENTTVTAATSGDAMTPVETAKMNINYAVFAQIVFSQLKGEMESYKSGKTEEQQKTIDSVLQDYVNISTKIALEPDPIKIAKWQNELKFVQASLDCLDSEKDIIFFTKSFNIIGKAITIIIMAAASAAIP